jgi:hypothetical protein
MSHLSCSPRIAALIEGVANETGVSVLDIISPQFRSHYIVQARHEAVRRVAAEVGFVYGRRPKTKKNQVWSCSKIAAIFHMDHTSILNVMKKDRAREQAQMV